MSFPEKCELCPRECGVDRRVEKGFCGGGEAAVIAKVMTHTFEEPCISGKSGSGAVFFSGCTLGCVYCQNRDISGRDKLCGNEYTTAELARLFCDIEKSGVHNLNLVTPSHYAVQVYEALEIASPHIPVIYNIGGYEKPQTVERYMSHADVFLTDFKYFSPLFSKKYSAAENYFEVAAESLAVMYKTVGKAEFSPDGMIKRGIVLRHLVLPGLRHDSVAVLEAVSKIVPPKNIILSLMSQYTPDFAPSEFRELSRRVTSFEYNYVLDAAVKLGFDGYFQDRDSASTNYTPKFR